MTPHLTWARAIARGVRADYRFGQGSQEEQDLESVAYLTLVRKAAAFDPGRWPPGEAAAAFRGYAHPSVRGECHREAVRLRNGGTFSTR